MEYLIGIGLALAVSVAATAIGFDRDRSFYPTIMAVIAVLYALFAVMGGSVQALWAESPQIALFLLACGLGFKRNLWWVVAALAAHGVMDWFHSGLIHNPGVPVWWPKFCLAYDVVAAAYLGWILVRRPEQARPVKVSATAPPART